MRQGDPADCMYAIVSGRLQLFTESGDGTQRFLAELRSGETVGEVDLIDGRPRMATARAVRDSELVKVSRLGFERLVGGNADSLNKVANILAGRMRALAHREHLVPRHQDHRRVWRRWIVHSHLRSAPSCAKRSARSGRYFISVKSGSEESTDDPSIRAAGSPPGSVNWKGRTGSIVLEADGERSEFAEALRSPGRPRTGRRAGMVVARFDRGGGDVVPTRAMAAGMRQWNWCCCTRSLAASSRAQRSGWRTEKVVPASPRSNSK